MGRLINVRAAHALMTRLESSDPAVADEALDEARATDDEKLRVELLGHAARHCGVPSTAKEAFDAMRMALKAFPAELRAGQVEEIVRYGSKVSDIRMMAMDYVVGLFERGELGLQGPGGRPYLEFIAEVIKDRQSDVVVRAKALLEQA